jgi:hypothetical protein
MGKVWENRLRSALHALLVIPDQESQESSSPPPSDVNGGSQSSRPGKKYLPLLPTC